MYNIDYKELGKRIRTERRRQDLTQEKLAKMAEISDSFMRHIGRGEYNYQTDMFPDEIYNTLNRMSSSQRKVFLNTMKTLAAHTDLWSV